MAICASAAKLPSIASLGCLPREGHFFSRSSPEDQGLLCSDEAQNLSSSLLHHCSAGSSALGASQSD